jgi:hypothetical protein
MFFLVNINLTKPGGKMLILLFLVITVQVSTICAKVGSSFLNAFMAKNIEAKKFIFPILYVLAIYIN